MNTNKVIDWACLWVLLFGLWPIADPGHNLDGSLSHLDVTLHLTAAMVLLQRWKVVRRHPVPEPAPHPKL